MLNGAADKIDQHRQTALLGIIVKLRSVHEQYQGAHLFCNMYCDATVLGCLTKLMKALQILTPVEASYSNLSFDGFVKSIQSNHIFTHCETSNKGYYVNQQCQNRVKKGIDTSIREHEVALSGLELGNVDGLGFQAI